LTDLSLEIVIAISVALILAGDVALAFLMQAVSPTRVTLGPGDRRYKSELPEELGTVASSFRNRRGRVSVRGETWDARQANGCGGRLEAGGAVRIVDREGLTLVVAAT
jgi:membrane protein implicated in regulation of membrane protease activity